MEAEIWKDIVGFEGYYQISNLGIVKSIIREIPLTTKCGNNTTRTSKEKFIKQKLNISGGYLKVDISKNAKQKQLLIHRLIAEYFIPNPYNKPMVNHINGIKTDNRIVNLEWCTQKENMKHAFKTGLVGKRRCFVGLFKKEGNNFLSQILNAINMTPTKTITDYRQLSAPELHEHINFLEKTNKNIWDFIQSENPDRKEFTTLRAMTSQHSQMIRKCNTRLDQMRNKQTVSGNYISQFNYIK